MFLRLFSRWLGLPELGWFGGFGAKGDSSKKSALSKSLVSWFEQCGALVSSKMPVKNWVYLSDATVRHHTAPWAGEVVDGQGGFTCTPSSQWVTGLKAHGRNARLAHLGALAVCSIVDAASLSGKRRMNALPRTPSIALRRRACELAQADLRNGDDGRVRDDIISLSSDFGCSEVDHLMSVPHLSRICDMFEGDCIVARISDTDFFSVLVTERLARAWARSKAGAGETTDMPADGSGVVVVPSTISTEGFLQFLAKAMYPAGVSSTSKGENTVYATKEQGDPDACGAWIVNDLDDVTEDKLPRVSEILGK